MSEQAPFYLYTAFACVVITLAAAALLPDRSRIDLAEAPVLEPAGRAAGG